MRQVENPPNPYLKYSAEFLGEPPAAKLEVFEEVARQSKILLVAFKGETLVGTAQLALATKPNAPHRAEVQKLFVHTGARQQGIAQILMKAIEEEAQKAGRSLLVLDTRQGDPSEQLYQKLGYIQSGIIPQYVIDETGQFSATVVYYKII